MLMLAILARMISGIFVWRQDNGAQLVEIRKDNHMYMLLFSLYRNTTRIDTQHSHTHTQISFITIWDYSFFSIIRSMKSNYFPFAF